jgi:hypothetical protein
MTKSEAERPPLSIIPSHSAINLNISLSSKDANDRIVVPENGSQNEITLFLKDDYETVCTLTMPLNVTLSLAELAVLLPLVSAQAVRYNPVATQCYWYARAVYESIRRKYPASTEVAGPAFKKRGKHITLPVGEMGFIPVLVPCPVTSTHLTEIERIWSTRVKTISQVKTISEVILS